MYNEYKISKDQIISITWIVNICSIYRKFKCTKKSVNMIFKKESIKIFKMFSKIIISISRNLCDDLLYVETHRRTQDKNPLFLFTQVLYSLKNSLSMHFNTATLETIFKPDYSSIIKKPSYPRLILILSSQENSEAEISSNRFKYVTPEFKEAEAPFLN